MSKIKICGLRRPEDALMVNEGQPDFAGFILTPSKRRVTVKEAQNISKELSPSIARVGVFAKETPKEIAVTASILELDGIQLHFDTTQAFFDELKSQIILCSFHRTPFIWQRLFVPSNTGPSSEAFSRIASMAHAGLFDGLLLDACFEGQDGGTGKIFPWESAREHVAVNHLDSARIIIAGGLAAENVAAAIAFFKPFAVDVSSGVETDGYKDRDKILRFIDTARKAQVQ